MRRLVLPTLSLLAAAILLHSATAADWPAYRGPHRDGLSAETGLLPNWPEGGPKLLWKSDRAGQGYAGMAVVGGALYTMGARGDDEYLIALDDKGGERWATKIGPVHDWKANAWSRGPNATPTVDGPLVYALSSKGELLCAGTADGKEVWRINLPKEMESQVNPVGGGPENFGWGYCWSPLVDGEVLLLIPGGPKGLFAAIDKKTGKTIWRSGGVPDPATYSSPVVATIGGVKQYVAIVQTGVVAVSARDGSLLWRYTRDDPYPDVVCPSPLVKDNLVYVSVGNGGSSDLLKVQGDGKSFKVELAWSEKTLANKQGGVVLLDNHVYGYNEDRNWVCQDLETGQLAWPKKRAKQAIKSGSVLAAGGRLYILAEAGTVALVEATPKEFKPLSQFNLPEESKQRKPRGGLWSLPSLSDGKLYLRDQELIFCYQVK